MQLRLHLPACLAAGAICAFITVAAHAQDANREVVVTKADVGEVVEHVANRAGEFKEEFDSAVSHSMMDGTRMEDRAKRVADNLHDSAKRLRDVFHDKRDKNNPAVRDAADRTLAAGSELSKVLQEHRFTDKLQKDWDLLRSDLNALAEVYGLSPM